MKKETIDVKNYGDMLAKINELELVCFETDNGYQGEYLAILKDDEKLYYYIDNYGSCSGCDWLEDNGELVHEGDDYIYKNIPYKNALEYCGDIKPSYIVPITKPLTFTNEGERKGFKLKE